MLVEELQRRSDELDGIIMSAEDCLENAPDGLLRTSISNGHIQYYHRQSSNEKNGTYISRDNSTLPAELAQKEYANRVLRIAQRQKRAIDRAIETHLL